MKFNSFHTYIYEIVKQAKGIADSGLLKVLAVYNENVYNVMLQGLSLIVLFILHAARIPKIITAATSPMHNSQHSLFLFFFSRLSFVTYNFSPLQKEA